MEERTERTERTESKKRLDSKERVALLVSILSTVLMVFIIVATIVLFQSGALVNIAWVGAALILLVMVCMFTSICSAVYLAKR